MRPLHDRRHYDRGRIQDLLDNLRKGVSRRNPSCRSHRSPRSCDGGLHLPLPAAQAAQRQAHVPENCEDRLTEIFPKSFKHLRLCALDPYDLALPKLEHNIQRDRDDVKYVARSVPLDLEVLKERYRKELRWQLGNPEREDLTLKLWIDAIGEEKQR